MKGGRVTATRSKIAAQQKGEAEMEGGSGQMDVYLDIPALLLFLGAGLGTEMEKTD